MKINDQDFEITDTVEVEPEIGQNRFKLNSAKKNFKKRLFSAIILLILLCGFLLSGAIYTEMIEKNLKNADIASYFSIVLTAVLLSLCIFEMNRALGFKKWYYQILMICWALVIYLYPVSQSLYNFSFYIDLKVNTWLQTWQLPLIIVFYTISLMLISYLDKSLDNKLVLTHIVVTLIIIFGLKAFSITSLNLDLSLSKSRFSFNTVIWIWIMIILSDSFQYLGGMRFGKTKLSPNISPKKTWEGALIGLGTASTVGVVYSMMFKFIKPFQNYQPLREPMQAIGLNSVVLEVILYLLLSIIFPIIGLFGDLIFSWVKRQVKIKDYSNLIPGHGGAMDRLDAVMFAFFMLFIFIGFLPA